MIRINLLGVERQKVRKAIAFDAGQQLTVACSLVLVLFGLGIGGWYWSLKQSSDQVDADIVTSQQEAARLRSLLSEVQQFEARRGQLQQRVALIQQLRGGQGVPVQLLDTVSKSLPDMLWLTEMNETGSSLTIQGLSTTLIAVSDFVGNLGNTPLLQKPIEIVNTEVQNQQGSTPAQAGADLIKFTVKAKLAEAASPTSPSPATAKPGAAAAPGH